MCCSKTREKNAQAINAFRRVARTALGRTIVNFWRPHLEQAGGGHHAVLVAYHPKEDRFLIDDPAAFKMPCYWVDTRTLVAAMATFDDTPGIDSFRGYLVVHSGVGSPTPWDTEYSASVVLRGGA
ncbi:MAG: phytochelatin synthase family protein [Myxococcaceae bacterium]|nr:phytochelatin synthase family protein [Myxococcaceae bacterium]